MKSPLNERNRNDYLDALGITVWQKRGTVEAVDTEVETTIEPGLAQPADIAAGAAATRKPAARTPAEVALLDWRELRQTVSGCTTCGLHETRTQTVFGVGNEQADLLVIGEAPGAEEDRRGEPFVGRAGQLLDEMLRAIALDRQTVFIANVLKCRPPGNRDPQATEAASCRPFLDRQIALIQPRVILAVGRIAAQQLLGGDLPLGRMRGKPHVLDQFAAPIVVTYHPAYLLRSPSQKRKSWQDLCLARDLLRASST